jgi:hypothetical protein
MRENKKIFATTKKKRGTDKERRPRQESEMWQK